MMYPGPDRRGSRRSDGSSMRKPDEAWPDYTASPARRWECDGLSSAPDGQKSYPTAASSSLPTPVRRVLGEVVAQAKAVPPKCSRWAWKVSRSGSAPARRFCAAPCGTTRLLFACPIVGPTRKNSLGTRPAPHWHPLLRHVIGRSSLGLIAAEDAQKATRGNLARYQVAPCAWRRLRPRPAQARRARRPWRRPGRRRRYPRARGHPRRSRPPAAPG